MIGISQYPSESLRMSQMYFKHILKYFLILLKSLRLCWNSLVSRRCPLHMCQNLVEPLRISLDWRGEGDRERDRETNRQRDRDSDRQTNRQTEREKDPERDSARKGRQGRSRWGAQAMGTPPTKIDLRPGPLAFLPVRGSSPFFSFSVSLSLPPSRSVVFSYSLLLPLFLQEGKGKKQEAKAKKAQEKQNVLKHKKKPRKQHTN